MTLYQRWMHKRERELTLRDPHRRIFPFDWGLEWISNGHNTGSTDPLTYLKEHAETVLGDSDTFFNPPPIVNCSVKDDVLTMATPTPSPHPENNTVHCRLFPAPGSKAAVIVVPQWNADEGSHVRLCQIFKRLGITALRLCMPYHEQRLPPDMKRADYMVSPNIGRTVHATRQAVLEVRQLVRWLKEQGYERIAVMGTSVGSCVTYLAFVHDPSICTGVFNHVSSFFADVVWTGLSTRYIRWGLNGHISLQDLRQCWAPISPWFFIDRLKTCSRPHLLITAKYDLTFRPELTEKVLQQYQSYNIPHQRIALPCGHYTIAKFPFSYLDGWHMCQYLVGQLSPRT